MKIRYLTVQDVIWINLQVINKTIPFHFAVLEEATSYQYSLGKNGDVISRAANVFNGFRKLMPFSDGNLETGFYACLSFLEINGYKIKLSKDEAKAMIVTESAQIEPSQIEKIASPSDDHGPKAVKEVVKGLMSRFEFAKVPVS